MKFFAGLIIGILLCLALIGFGGYYLLGELKNMGQMQNANYAQNSASADPSQEALRQALEFFNAASNPQDMIAGLDRIISLRPEDPQAYAAKAALLMNSGDYQGALYNYNKALSLNPNSADLYLGRATALMMSGDYERANMDLTAALNLNPNLAQAYYNRGVSNVNLAQIKPAMADFEQAQKLFASAGDRANYVQASQALNIIKSQNDALNKNSAAAKAGIAKAARELRASSSPVYDPNREAKLKSELTRSLSGISAGLKNSDNKNMLQKFKQVSAGLNSGEVDIGDFNSFLNSASRKMAQEQSGGKKNLLDYTAAAKEKMAKGDYQGAAADLDKAIEMSSNPSSLYAQRAALNMQNKNYKAAYEDYSKAIESDKNNASALLNRAKLLSSMGNNKAAAADADAAKALYEQQGNKEGAIQAENISNLARGVNTQKRSVRDGISEALFKDASNAYAKGNYQESLNKFNELAQRQPEVPEVYYNRAIVNAAAGNKEAALKDYRQASAMNPNLPDARIGAASILMEQGKGEEAIKEINAALEINPNMPSAYRMRGMQTLQNGDAQKAVEDLSKAIELDNKDGASYFSRALGYAQQGNFDRAREDFVKANSLAAEQGNQELLNEVAKYQKILEDAVQQQARQTQQQAQQQVPRQ